MHRACVSTALCTLLIRSECKCVSFHYVDRELSGRTSTAHTQHKYGIHFSGSCFTILFSTKWNLICRSRLEMYVSRLCRARVCRTVAGCTPKIPALQSGLRFGRVVSDSARGTNARISARVSDRPPTRWGIRLFFAPHDVDFIQIKIIMQLKAIVKR